MTPQYKRLQSLLAHAPSPLQKVHWPTIADNEVELFVKRDDLLHSQISGNKWRKLLPQVAWLFRKSSPEVLVSLGGMHSNHLAALAALGKTIGVETRALVRGELPIVLTPTLAFAKTCGMQIESSSRADFRAWREGLLPKLASNEVWIPEGGTSWLGLIGMKACVREIKQQLGNPPDYIFTAAGSGGTAAGLARAASPTLVYAISAVNDPKLPARVGDLLQSYPMSKGVLHWNFNHVMGGFASGEDVLLKTMQTFKAINGFDLDPIYTTKALLGLEALVESGDIPRGSRVVLLHTGGLQGVEGWMKRYFPTKLKSEE